MYLTESNAFLNGNKFEDVFNEWYKFIEVVKLANKRELKEFDKLKYIKNRSYFNLYELFINYICII